MIIDFDFFNHFLDLKNHCLVMEPAFAVVLVFTQYFHRFKWVFRVEKEKFNLRVIEELVRGNG